MFCSCASTFRQFSAKKFSSQKSWNEFNFFRISPAKRNPDQSGCSWWHKYAYWRAIFSDKRSYQSCKLLKLDWAHSKHFKEEFTNSLTKLSNSPFSFRRAKIFLTQNFFVFFDFIFPLLRYNASKTNSFH